MPSEKIVINGEPVLLRLDSLNAKEVPSKFGSGREYVYQCNGGAQHVYLPDDAVESVRNSGARAGDQVTIQRKKEGQYVRWIVRVVSDAAEPPAGPDEGRRAFDRLPAAPESSPRPSVSPRAPLPANLYTAPTVAANYGGMLAGALCASINAFAEAQAYATRSGLRIEFSAEDVRAAAISIFIQSSKEAR